MSATALTIALLCASGICVAHGFYIFPASCRLWQPAAAANVFNDAHLRSLSRKDLQQLAKENDVKANLRSEEIIDALLHGEKVSTSGSSSTERATARKGGSDSLDDARIASLLQEQGLAMRDVYDLRDSIMKEAKRKVSTDDSEEEARRKEAKRLANLEKSNLIKGEKKQLKSSISAIFGADSPSFKSNENSEGAPAGTVDASKDGIRRPAASPLKPLEANTIDVERLLRVLPVEAPVVVVAAGTKRKRDPLEGATLESILSYLEARLGYAEMYARTRLKFFQPEKGPSVRSALAALRQKEMMWARREVEFLYRKEVEKDRKRAARD